MSSLQSDIRPGLVKYATFILNQRPYFRHKLREKLILRCRKLECVDYAEVIENILDDLSKSGYLDDSYLAEAFVRRQLAKGYGSRFIRLKLLALKLSSENISIALENIATFTVEMESARHIIAKKRITDPRKAVSVLYQRGFDSKITRKLFDAELPED